MRDLKMRHQTAGMENAGLENAENDIVWNAAHCLCLLSFAGSKRWVGLKELECERYRSVVNQLTTIATLSRNQTYALQCRTLQSTAHHGKRCSRRGNYSGPPISWRKLAQHEWAEFKRQMKSDPAMAIKASPTADVNIILQSENGVHCNSERTRIRIRASKSTSLYERVRTAGVVKYLKCCVTGCDGSTKLVSEQFFPGVSHLMLIVSCRSS